MTSYFAQASIDEHGQIAGGQAGNQSGVELNTRNAYSNSSNPWWSIIPKAEAVRLEANRQAKAAVGNPYIGYDQHQRNTALTEAKKVGWDLSKITVPCEVDCASLLALVLICAVYRTLGNAAGDAVYKAFYYDGNLPATSTFKGKLASLGDYFAIGGASYTPGYGLVRDGHAVIAVDGLVPAAVLSGSVSTPSGLASASYPCKGWKGDEVKKLQSALIAKGYSCGSCGVDGSFGPDTDAAVRKFQKDNGLEVDGIVGPKTQGALYGSLPTAATSSSTAASPSYPLGDYVTTVDSLNVRTGCGVDKPKKSKGQLTADGQKHSNGSGQLNSGTTVTVMQVQYDSAGNPWGMIPSGWICLNWQGKAYARKA